MAKTKVKYVDAPPRNDVYFGMLVLTVLTMLFGVALLTFEIIDMNAEPDLQAVAAERQGIKIVTPSKSAAEPVGGANTPAPAPAPGPMGMP